MLFSVITKLSSKKQKINLKLKGTFKPDFCQIAKKALLLLAPPIIPLPILDLFVYTVQYL